MTKQIMAILLIILLAAACAPASANTAAPDSTSISPITTEIPIQEQPAMPYTREPKDANLTRGNVFIQETGLLIRESYPPQIALSVSGDLPTPCHQLRADITAPDIENKISVDVYTVVDPNMMCIQVLKSFQENIELGTFPNGHYSVWVNGALAGEFDS